MRSETVANNRARVYGFWAVRSYHRSRGVAPKTRSSVPRTITEMGLRSTKRSKTAPSIMASLWVVIEKAYSIESRGTLTGLGSSPTLSEEKGDGEAPAWVQLGVRDASAAKA